MSEPARVLVCCPECGAQFPAPYVQYLSTCTETYPLTNSAPQARSTQLVNRPPSGARALPDRAGPPIKASLWKRALGIAHLVIDEFPDDGASQTDAFKSYCVEQGLDYSTRAGKEGRPLFARALEFAHQQRQRRRGTA
jgi:hypothetical protein